MKEKTILICSKIRKRNEKILSKKPLFFQAEDGIRDPVA